MKKTKKEVTTKEKEQIIDKLVAGIDDYVPSEFMYGDCIFTGDPVGYISDEIGHGLVLVGKDETLFVSQKEVDTVIRLIRAYTGK